MIDPSTFDELVAEVAALNDLDLATADLVVGAVGDCMEIDPATGLVIANLSDGRTLSVKWPEGEDDENED